MPATSTRRKKLIPTENVNPEKLKPHPRNYRVHTEEQMRHLKASIREHGFYRNVVIAKDDTILAGHGAVLAAINLGYKEIPTIRLNIKPDDSRALKILAGDNEIANLALTDDRALTEMLKQIKEDTEDLLGTGFDDQILANLVMVTRHSSEIADFDEAAEWLGMPEFDVMGRDNHLKMLVHFDSEDEKQQFLDRLGLEVDEKTRSVWWPPKKREDPGSIIVEG